MTFGIRIAAALMALSGALELGIAPATASEVAPAAVVALKSSARPYVDTLVLRGRTEANRRVDVKSEIGGLIISEPLEKGTHVKAGEVLCHVKMGDREAEMTEAMARLREADIEFQAADKLAKKGFGSEITANTKSALLEAARASVLRAKINIGRLEIKAPFDGVLISNTAELGELMQSGATCASMISLNPIKLVAFAPERTVDALARGAKVNGALITGRKIEGVITYIARAADRDTRTYLIEATSDNENLSIRDGMTAELRVALEGQNAHLLPQTALTLDNEGLLGVRLVKDGEAWFAAVTILRDQPDGVWVAGLPDSVEVIVVGQEFVTDGKAVAPEYISQDLLQ
jgi:multidrug efflux system membrane fusion protein